MVHNINVNRNRSFSRCYRSWTLEWTEKFHWSFEGKFWSQQNCFFGYNQLKPQVTDPSLSSPPHRRPYAPSSFSRTVHRHSLCKCHWLWFVCLVRPYLHCQHIYTTKNIKKKKINDLIHTFYQNIWSAKYAFLVHYAILNFKIPHCT